jgi:hypothetical protein
VRTGVVEPEIITANGRRPDVEVLPPHDIEAEEAVIASLLVDPEAIAKVAPILDAGDFFREKNGWAYEACRSLADRSESINQITVAHELARRNRLEDVGGAAYLSQLVTDLPTSVGVEHYAAIVKEMASRNELISVGTQIARKGFDLEQDLGSTLSEAAEMVMGIEASTGGRPKLVSAGENPPPRREYLVDGWLEIGSTALLYGGEECAKTWLTLDLDICIASGIPFFGRSILRPGPVVCAHVELTSDEMLERAWQLARGLGLPRPPADLHFLPLTKPLLASWSDLRSALHETRAVLLSFDSLTLAGIGDETAARAAFFGFTSLATTCILVDHQARTPPSRPGLPDEYSSRMPYGSMVKEAGVYHSWQVQRATEAELQSALDRPAPYVDLILRDRKHRGGPRRATMAIRLAGDEERVTLTLIDAADSQAVLQRLSRPERILTVMRSRGAYSLETAVTVEEIVADTGDPKKGTGEDLSRLRKRGLVDEQKAERVTDFNLWWLASRQDASHARLAVLHPIGAQDGRLDDAQDAARRSQDESQDEQAISESGQPDNCAICGGGLHYYDPEGTPFCERHGPGVDALGYNRSMEKQPDREPAGQALVANGLQGGEFE